MAPLRNPRHEKVAQELALMHDAYAASLAAGYDPTKSAFKPNARKRANRKDVQARKAQILAKEADLVSLDAAWIQRRLVEICKVELGVDRIKTSDQIAGLTLLAKMIGALAPELHDVLLVGLGDRLNAARARLPAS
jgi:hypothetical protein